MAVPVCVQSRQSRVDSCGKASLLTMLQRRVPSRGFRSVLKAITISTNVIARRPVLLLVEQGYGVRDARDEPAQKLSAPAMSDLTWLNPTPHAIAVYASSPLSPAVTQHSYQVGAAPYLGRTYMRRPLSRTFFGLGKKVLRREGDSAALMARQTPTASSPVAVHGAPKGQGLVNGSAQLIMRPYL